MQLFLYLLYASVYIFLVLLTAMLVVMTCVIEDALIMITSRDSAIMTKKYNLY